MKEESHEMKAFYSLGRVQVLYEGLQSIYLGGSLGLTIYFCLRIPIVPWVQWCLQASHQLLIEELECPELHGFFMSMLSLSRSSHTALFFSLYI